jgi:hypothetical protein
MTPAPPLAQAGNWGAVPATKADLHGHRETGVGAGPACSKVRSAHRARCNRTMELEL